MTTLVAAPEVRRLLNPGFLSVVIAIAAEGYQDERQESLPFLLALLVPPLILHRETRENLPKVVVTKLSDWAKNYPQLIHLVPKHTQEFLPLTKEAIIFGSNIGTLTVNSDGSLISLKSPTRSKIVKAGQMSVEIPDIVKRAYFAGRWLAHAGTIATIYSILGIGLDNADH